MQRETTKGNVALYTTRTWKETHWHYYLAADPLPLTLYRLPSRLPLTPFPLLSLLPFTLFPLPFPSPLHPVYPPFFYLRIFTPTPSYLVMLLMLRLLVTR